MTGVRPGFPVCAGAGKSKLFCFCYSKSRRLPVFCFLLSLVAYLGLHPANSKPAMDPLAFHPQNDYLLQNDRVLLRPLHSTDWQHLLPFAQQEPELWRYALAGAAGPDNLRQYIAAALEGRASGKEYPFIVWDKKQNSYAGCTRFYDMQPAQQTTQLGYTWYGKAFQGTGLNRHCKYLLLQFAFGTMQVARVEFRADAANSRSIAAMKAIGCTPEGILRSNGLRPDGTRRDSIVLSILKWEWEESVEEMLKGKLSG